jgi:hypothetical protein
MKVALCFSGKLGAWKQTRDSISENVISPLKPDIFLSTWENEDYRSFCKYYKPTRFSALDYSNHEGKMKSSTIDIWSGLKPMTFGMKKVFRVFEDYVKLHKKDYDLVIRLRPDLDVLNQIKPQEIKDAINRKHIKLPFYEGHKIYDHEKELKKEFAFSFVYEKAILPDQINDQIAIGAPKQMKKYMNCFDSIEEPVNFMWNQGYPDYMCRIPECILTMYLKMNNIKYSPLTGSTKYGNLKTKLIK